MGFLRHKSDSTITIDKSKEEVFNALISAGQKVGKVKDQSKMAGYVVIRTKLFSLTLSNPATVRVSLKTVSENQTEVSFNSDSFDGVIGLGSAGKAIDSIIKELEITLS